MLPYSLLSIGPGADPSVQAARKGLEAIHQAVGCHYFLQGRCYLPSRRERHRPSAGTKLYCLVTEAHACEQLALGCYLEADQARFELATFRIVSERSTVKPHRPPAE